MRRNEVQEVEFDVDELPVSTRVQVVRASSRQRIDGLDADELMDTAELDRWAEWQFFGPVLSLPVTPNTGGRVPVYADGAVDWPASSSPGRPRPAAAPPLQRALKVLAAAGVTEPASVLCVLVERLRTGVLRLDQVTHPELRRALGPVVYPERL